MTFYRPIIAAVAGLSLAATVFAGEVATTAKNTGTNVKNLTVATATKATTTDAAAKSAEKVNINTATSKDLAKVKGLTAAKAKAIVRYRKKHGEFKSLDDLKSVKSLKKLDLQPIEDQLTI
jgi:competence protein ComEA